MPEENKGRIARAKQHLQENHKVYLGVAGGLTAGYFLHSQSTRIKQIIGSYNFLYKSSQTNIVITEMVRRGHPGNILCCLETGEVFASQNRAAKVLRIHPYELHRYLKGFIPNANGYTFEKLGEAA